jgi:hypothetical protein
MVARKIAPVLRMNPEESCSAGAATALQLGAGQSGRGGGKYTGSKGWLRSRIVTRV